MWNQAVKKYKEIHQCSLKEAMVGASKTYQKVQKVIKGGKIENDVFQKMLKSSYKDEGDNNIGDFQLDKELSTKTSKVYNNPNIKKTAVVHRGASGVIDWGNNAIFAIGGKDAYMKTSRFKNAKDTQLKAEEKYGKASAYGHSQGALISQLVASPNTDEVITYNTASHPIYKIPKLERQTNIRTSKDIVSSFSHDNDIVIPSTSNSILENHKTDALSRLGDVEIGKGLRKPRKKRVISKNK